MKILIIGEECKDVFIYGNINRLCPEAPVPVFEPSHSVTNRGMAGNVHENIKAIEPTISIDIWKQSEKIVKTRFVDAKSNQMIMRLDEESVINSEKKLDLDAINYYDVIIVSDYNKGFLSDKDIMDIGAASKGKISIIDSKRLVTDNLVKDFMFVKLNRSEYTRVQSTLVRTANVIITLGEEGCIINGTKYESKDPLQTIDVSGAGDTFVAAFVTKFYNTKDVSVSATFANEMAARVVSKRGVTTP